MYLKGLQFKNLTKGDKEPFMYLEGMTGNMSYHYFDLCMDFVEKYIAVITVESPNDDITVITRDLSASILEKVGIMGGWTGLFTGFSMLSIISILEYIYNVIWPEKVTTSSADLKQKRKYEQPLDKIIFDEKVYQRNIDVMKRIKELEGNQKKIEKNQNQQANVQREQEKNISKVWEGLQYKYVPNSKLICDLKESIFA